MYLKLGSNNSDQPVFGHPVAAEPYDSLFADSLYYEGPAGTDADDVPAEVSPVADDDDISAGKRSSAMRHALRVRKDHATFAHTLRIKKGGSAYRGHALR